MKALILAISLMAVLASQPAVAALWDYHGIALDVQAQKNRQGGGREQGQRGRDARAERPPEADQRRERLNEDERRALHRDLDKANRELYRRR
jgi:hypothetical protein